MKSESFKFVPFSPSLEEQETLDKLKFLPKGYDPRREFMFKEKDIDQALVCHAILTRKIIVTEKDVYGQTHGK